ncbi:outer membrane lipoprotein LolB [Candidatus Pandoraea novymonadis]|uniref:Outer-membrane lipoprotein LolB n=1 Tax=Candidatus Pandoraea novymonadis TaxID=1808959 RepID=A0ABX5FDG2_9BURK|nr:outer membrane lipoprotein LolB [Candidatus Pandoraea novymonadis]PSB91770.1 Outer-membrane lipoprotein LolB [Candidatus Pandoraea novymonadis]
MIFVTTAGCAKITAHNPLTSDESMDIQIYRGRFSIHYGQYESPLNTYGNFIWKQSRETVDVQFLDLFGQTQLTIRSTLYDASVTLRGKSPLTGLRIEDVMQKTFGFRLPVSGLRYWLQIQQAPGSLAQITRDPKSGRVTRLIQDGWTIEYQSYFESTPTRVKRLNIKRTVDDGTLFSAKLVIDE